MFTGLIEEIGRLRTIGPRGAGLAVEIGADAILDGLQPGHSVSVSGVCLTVVEMGDGSFKADILGETRRRTYLERLRPGSQVNLERPLRAGDRFGGHFVQGHVDGCGEIVTLRPQGSDKLLVVRYPGELAVYLVEKGSVALDGISLTVAHGEPHRLHVALIPETLKRTTMGTKRPGDPVHIEVDLIGKYVERCVRQRL